jgi:hypothetical protein
MAYFPEQLMPANMKDESQDVRGNHYVACAADHNKIDEEIRSVELYLGIKSPSLDLAGPDAASPRSPRSVDTRTQLLLWLLESGQTTLSS